MSQPVQITDTILRDAHQCLIATRMRTCDMLPICSQLDAIGFWSLEVWGGATFDACLRFLKEDPWERLRSLRQALPNTRLQMLLRGQNLLGYRHYPDDVVHAFVAKAADGGVDVFRIFDALNDERNLTAAIHAVKKAGKHAQGTIAYTTSPVHDIEGFVALARALEEAGVDSICIKDMAGLLTPVATRELIPALKAAVEVPLQLHSHATSGLSMLCQWEAVQAGCYHIDTAISSFSGGASHACTESMVAALRDTPFDTGLDLAALQDIGFYFHEVRKKYHQFESEFTGTDTRVQLNQIPGGMISNLYSQLKQQGALDKMAAVQEEIPLVRRDLGYPPLVTPTSQVVGTQAVLNVMTGERYKNLTNEVKLYLQGRYGRSPAPVCSDLRQKAIGNESVIDCRPADLLSPEMESIREQAGKDALSDEDVLTFAMFPDVGAEFLKHRNAGTMEPEPLTSVSTDGAIAGLCGHAPREFDVSLHGESYHIAFTGSGRAGVSGQPFYLTIDGIPEEILLTSLDAPEGQASPASSKQGLLVATHPGHVTASMPGTVVDVLVTVGDRVQAGDPVLVIEAMKMETEIQATLAGIVQNVHVVVGMHVEPDLALVEIEST